MMKNASQTRFALRENVNVLLLHHHPLHQVVFMTLIVTLTSVAMMGNVKGSLAKWMKNASQARFALTESVNVLVHHLIVLQMEAVAVTRQVSAATNRMFALMACVLIAKEKASIVGILMTVVQGLNVI